MMRFATGRLLHSRQRPFLRGLGLLGATTSLFLFVLGCGGDSAPITAETSKYEVADDSHPGGAGGNSGEAPAAPAGAGMVAGVGDADASGVTGGIAATPPQDGSETPAGGIAAPPKPSANPGEPGTSAGTAGGGTAGGGTAGGGAAGLLAQIRQLQGQDPRGATQEETIANLVKQHRQVVGLAGQVFTENATEEQLQQAAQLKIQSLALLSQVQREAQTELQAFMSELKRSPQPSLQRIADRMDFAQQLDRFANGEAEDSGKLLARFQQFFKEEPQDANLFTLSQQVTETFIRTGNTDQAAVVMKLVADTFETSKDERLANAGKMVREQLAIIEVKLEDKVDAVLEGKPKAGEEFLAALDKMFGDRELGAMTLQFMSQIAHLLESRDLELAGQTYAKMVAAFEKRSTPELLKDVKESAEKFGKRKALIGQTFVVEGNTLDGKPFDWKQYQGKVVLVDFWATWCGPCIREIPNIKQNYDQYQSQGFEVVGVNVDEDPAALQKFFSVQKLPWTTVVSSDPQKVGFEHPLMVQCGVEGIPFLVLVDRDGKAIALNLRGEELGKKLASMFGGAPAGTPAAPAATNSPAAAPNSSAPSPSAPSPDSPTKESLGKEAPGANPLRAEPAKSE